MLRLKLNGGSASESCPEEKRELGVKERRPRTRMGVKELEMNSICVIEKDR